MWIQSVENRDLLGCYYDFFGFYGDLTGFNSDLRGFQSDLRGFQSDLMGFDGDVNGTCPLVNEHNHGKSPCLKLTINGHVQ